MSFFEHLDALKKDLQTMNSQLSTNKTDIEKTRQEMTQLQLQIQQATDQQTAQLELAKMQENAKKLETIAKTYLPALSDANIQVQLMNEVESVLKSGQSGMPVSMSQPMAAMNAAAAAAMQPHMMMRNPMMGMGGASPRVSKGGGPQNGMSNGGMNGMQHAMMAHQMQLAHMQALMHAQMFQGVPMMGMPGMPMPGMPPGMAGLPGMMPPSTAAAAAAMQQFTAAQQQMAAAISVSTPSRNHSASGHASRTRTPLTASATNSPRPAEPPIKEEDHTPTDPEVSTAATTQQQQQPQQPQQTVAAAAAAAAVSEDNTTVAVA